MSRLFVYEVNGSVFEDTEAFGEAWKEAKRVATEEHTYIERQTVYADGRIVNEFYADGGIFLNERFFENTKVRIF